MMGFDPSGFSCSRGAFPAEKGDVREFPRPRTLNGAELYYVNRLSAQKVADRSRGGEEDQEDIGSSQRELSRYPPCRPLQSPSPLGARPWLRQRAARWACCASSSTRSRAPTNSSWSPRRVWTWAAEPQALGTRVVGVFVLITTVCVCWFGPLNDVRCAGVYCLRVVCCLNVFVLAARPQAFSVRRRCAHGGAHRVYGFHNCLSIHGNNISPCRNVSQTNTTSAPSHTMAAARHLAAHGWGPRLTCQPSARIRHCDRCRHATSTR